MPPESNLERLAKIGSVPTYFTFANVERNVNCHGHAGAEDAAT